MKSPKHYLLLLLTLLTGFMLHAQTPWLHVKGNKILDPAGNVVILRGLDIKDLATEAAQKADPLSINALIDKITNKNDPASHSPGWYPKIIRFTIDPGITNFEIYYTGTLKPAVDSATAKGVYVILDNHYVDDIASDMAYSENLWTFMAPKFRNYPNVIFELFNENSATMTWAVFKPYMQTLINVVREYAPHNLIFAGSPQWDQQMQGSATSPFTGGNIVYVAHIYPSQFIVNGKYTSIVTNVETALKKNPIVMTEWGWDSTLTTNTVLDGSKSAYGEPIMRWADSLGISWTAWCADNNWQPAMFQPNWTLKTNPGDMGGFVKDTLYQKRNDNQPANIYCAAPYLGLTQSICGMDSVIIPSGIDTSGVTIAWYRNDTLIAGATDSALVVKTAGSYKIVVTVADSNACVMTDSVTIQTGLLPINLGPNKVVTDSVTLVADSSYLPYTYQWYQNGTLLPNDTSYSLKIFDTCNSYYVVKVSYPGCGAAAVDTFKLLCLREPFLGHPIPIPGKVQAEDYDVENEPNIAYYTPSPSAGGGVFRFDGIGVETTSDAGGGYDVGYLASGEWLQYTISVKDSAYYTLGFRVASDLGGGQLQLLLNGTNTGNTIYGTNGANISGTINIPNTGGWQTGWTTVTAPDSVFLTPQDTLLELLIVTAGFNINYIDIELAPVAVTGITTASGGAAPLTIFPNPVSDVLNISGSGGAWQLLNLLGQPVAEGTGNQVDVHALNSGQYVLNVGGGFYKIIKW